VTFAARAGGRRGRPRPLAVATCDIDTGLIHGRVPFPGPFPLGHERVGEVVEVGREVTTVAVGQRVIIPFQISCGCCARCSRGLSASCERVDFGAMYGLEPFGGPWRGFLSDVVRVPWADQMPVPLPDGVDPVAVASLSDNIPDRWRTVAPSSTTLPKCRAARRRWCSNEHPLLHHRDRQGPWSRTRRLP
jgi:threonine dehydrogenase-like Zn-dependent dehydrogenase